MAKTSITITTMDSQAVLNKIAKKKLSKEESDYFKKVIAMINEVYKHGKRA
ncbi:hypothetical protein HYY69_05750 [Candidatus Woesearchaeota archaeon]|nr:hypothetical protein [Candidatus Woesearchaeota archaeon]